MKVRHEINGIQFPHKSYVMLQAWLVMQAWPCNLNECDGLLRQGVGGVGDGKRIRVVWLSLSMTICTANHGGRQIYVMILGSEKKKVTEKLARYFVGEFQKNQRYRLLSN